jgi:HD domain-containing protein
VLEELDREFAARQTEVAQFRDIIRRANQPTVLEEEAALAVQDLARRPYRDLAGDEHPYLTPDEVEKLSVRKGSLTEYEREEINKHVQKTYDFLKTLPWTNEFRKVPDIAWKHHATLNGTGYPREERDGKLVQRWTAAEIPIQSRMMTISDIFDALAAKDRPYKRAVPVGRALDILNMEARDGRLDKDLLAIFVEAKVYEKSPPPKKESEVAG